MNTVYRPSEERPPALPGRRQGEEFGDDDVAVEGPLLFQNLLECLLKKPESVLFVYQCPAPREAGTIMAYRGLLAGNTCLVAFAGVAGNVRLHRLLLEMTGSPMMASRVMWSWILITGLAGCELSWICSPYLARPDLPVSFFNPNAFRSNFFEYLWRTVSGVLT